MELAHQVAVHVVAEHRRLRRALPRFADLAAHTATAGEDAVHHRAAQRAVAFLDQDVLAHADIEDAVIDQLTARHDATAEIRRLRPYHDSLRDAAARLHDHLDSPSGQFDIAGQLAGVHDLLVVHLDDEWRTLVPLLADLDPDRATMLQPLVDSHPAPDRDGDIRLYLPTTFVVARARILAATRQHRQLARSADAAVRRAARSDVVPLRDNLDVTIDLVPIVSSPRIALLAGRLISAEIETVLAPVDFEVSLTADGDHAAILAVAHSLVPVRPLAAQAPAHRLTDTAIHALAGHLAAMITGRSDHEWPRPTSHSLTN